MPASRPYPHITTEFIHSVFLSFMSEYQMREHAIFQAAMAITKEDPENPEREAIDLMLYSHAEHLAPREKFIVKWLTTGTLALEDYVFSSSDIIDSIAEEHLQSIDGKEALLAHFTEERVNTVFSDLTDEEKEEHELYQTALCFLNETYFPEKIRVIDQFYEYASKTPLNGLDDFRAICLFKDIPDLFSNYVYYEHLVPLGLFIPYAHCTEVISEALFDWLMEETSEETRAMILHAAKSKGQAGYEKHLSQRLSAPSRHTPGIYFFGHARPSLKNPSQEIVNSLKPGHIHAP